jgi:NDP-sugar pyrophosphorylase family protein
VRVGGYALIDRVLTSLAEVNPSEVVVIVNDASVSVRDHVSSQAWPFAIRWIVETTPSSMHSFLRVVETMAANGDAGPFLISTVDTVASPGAFATFASACEDLDADLVLAVAAPPDDEKPLLVRLAADDRRVEAIGAATAARGNSRRGSGISRAEAPLATTGYYAVRASVLREADEARREGLPALRKLFERLLTRDYRVAAVRVAAGIDVDRPADVGAAEAFLKQVGM